MLTTTPQIPRWGETHAELTSDDSSQLYAIPKLAIGEVWSNQAGGDIIPPNI